LNRLKWDEKLDLKEAKIIIEHRGAPANQRAISGADVMGLGRGLMQIAGPEGEVMIPYHRILRIEIQGNTIWEKARR
jgi:uncharacterized protein (UPF0248 family)